MSRNASGGTIARIARAPKRNQINPPSTQTNEMRVTKTSAPSWPNVGKTRSLPLRPLLQRPCNALELK